MWNQERKDLTFRRKKSFTRQWKTKANNFPYVRMMSDTVPVQLYVSNVFHRCLLELLAHSKFEHSAYICATESLSVRAPCSFHQVTQEYLFTSLTALGNMYA